MKSITPFFLYWEPTNINRENYWKNEKDVIRKKGPFPKPICEASHLLSIWTNNYSGKYNNGKNDANNGMAFTTVTEEIEKDDKNEKNNILHALNARKKDITPTSAQKNCLRHPKRRVQVC